MSSIATHLKRQEAQPQQLYLLPADLLTGQWI